MKILDADEMYVIVWKKMHCWKEQDTGPEIHRMPNKYCIRFLP